ncbi:MAG: Coenzyme F420 hydrogenase/dehydrogenase, beta subunit C-terminal domain, partial [Firmicutes bacterium]|nr:Coenzyme F420 hydrogenase/dehydrogenase, beta subunit C-terminal domain [Bacillota bacterium]
DEKDMVPGLGAVKNIYLTRAQDPEIRAKAQHGGSATALLSLALKEGLIDSAALTKSSGALSPKGILAASEEEIKKCSGSAFQIAPSLSELNLALEEGKYKKTGVVGTPCKTLAAYKIKSYLAKDPKADRIGLIIGLFCGWGLDWRGLNELSEKSGLSSPEHIDIPPSKFHSIEFSGENKVCSADISEVYPIIRENCRYCADMTAEFADISIGGARSEEDWEFDKGWNQVITRTEAGEALIKLAKERKVLEFREAPEWALQKLKAASEGKKRTAIKNLKERFGSMEYLEPSRRLFENI